MKIICNKGEGEGEGESSLVTNISEIFLFRFLFDFLISSTTLLLIIFPNFNLKITSLTKLIYSLKKKKKKLFFFFSDLGWSEN